MKRWFKPLIFILLISFSCQTATAIDLSKEMPLDRLNSSSVYAYEINTTTDLYSVLPDRTISAEIILPVLVCLTVARDFSPKERLTFVGPSPKKDKAGSLRLVLEPGSRHSLKDLYRAILINDSYDARHAVTSLYKSPEAFSDRLKDTVKFLGLDHTFVTGAFAKQNHRTNPKDVAKVMKALSEHPVLYPLAMEKPDQAPDLPRRSPFEETGDPTNPLCFYSEDGNLTFLFTSSQGLFVAALAGAKDTKEANADAISLLEWFQNYFRVYKIISKGDIITSLRWEEEDLPIKTGKDVYILQTGPEFSQPNYSVNYIPNRLNQEQIHINEPVGSAEITLGEDIVETVDMLAAKAMHSIHYQGSKKLSGWLWIPASLLSLVLLALILGKVHRLRIKKATRSKGHSQ